MEITNQHSLHDRAVLETFFAHAFGYRSAKLLDEHVRERYEPTSLLRFEVVVNQLEETEITDGIWFEMLDGLYNNKVEEREEKLRKLKTCDIGLMSFSDRFIEIAKELSFTLSDDTIGVILNSVEYPFYMDDLPPNFICLNPDEFNVKEYEDRIYWEFAYNDDTRLTDSDVMLARLFDNEHKVEKCDIGFTVDPEVVVRGVEKNIAILQIGRTGNEDISLIFRASDLYLEEQLKADMLTLENELRIDYRLSPTNLTPALLKLAEEHEHCFLIDTISPTDIYRDTLDLPEAVLRDRESKNRYVPSLETAFRNIVVNGEEHSLVDQTLCFAPFLTATINPARYKLCCAEEFDDFDTKYTDWDSFWNSDRAKEMRRGLIMGTPPEGCRACIAGPANPIRVRSLEYLKRFHPHVALNDDFSVDSKPRELLVVPSNKCNLACKMCSSHYSTTFDSSAYKTGMHDNKHGLVEITETDFAIIKDLAHNLTYVNITGGDSFYDPKTLGAILDGLDPFAANIEILMNINGHNVDWDLMERLSKYRKLQLFFSIDGTKEACDKQRLFSNRERLVENVLEIHKRYGELTNVRLGCHVVITNINTTTLPAFSTEIVDVFQNVFDTVAVDIAQQPHSYACWNQALADRDDVISMLSAGMDEMDIRLPAHVRELLIKMQKRIYEEVIGKPPMLMHNLDTEEKEAYWKKLAIPVTPIEDVVEPEPTPEPEPEVTPEPVDLTEAGEEGDTDE